MRFGKGFSKSELKEAGIDFKQALRLAMPVDLRRRTRHEENVNVIRQHLGLQAPKISKPPEILKEPSKKPSKPGKVEVKKEKPAIIEKPKKPEKAEKPTKQKKADVSKPSKKVKTTKSPKTKAAKAEETEKPTPKKSVTKRKTTKSKSAEKT
jgi:hypothetical protein